MNHIQAIEIMRQVGIWSLGTQEGCNCLNFEICAVSVVISCHKSGHSIRVWSDHMERDPRGLEAVAKEVVQQFAAIGSKEYVSGYVIRFCEYSDDNKNGRWENGKWVKEQQCCYCHANRPEPDAYLCEECKRKESAVYCYPWTKAVFAEEFL